MKKIMKQALALTAAIVTSAAVQAAAINWSAPVNAMLDADGNVLANAAVLLIQTATGAGAPTIGWDSGLTISGGTYLGQTVLNASGKISPAAVVTITGTWSAGTINVLGGAAYGQPGTVAATGYAAGNSRDYYMVVCDGGTISETSQFAMTSLANKFSSSDGGALTLTFGTLAGSATGTGSDWAPVPEPTSVALLAIGVAAIGLRRRFRK